MEPHTLTPDWHPRATVAKLDGVRGLDLVRIVRDVDPDRLDARGKVRYLQATERAIAWLSGLQADALVACAGAFVQRDEHDVDGSRLVTIEDASRSEVAAATRWSEPWTHERICTARLLAGPLDATRRALGEGTITPRHADAIASAAQRLSGYADWIGGPGDPHRSDRAVVTFIGACRTLQTATLPVAARRSVAATRKAAERALVSLDSTDSRMRRESELRNRDVYVVPEPDGMALLIARMGLAQAQACLAVITGIARDPRLSLPADTPTEAGIGERRTEALTHLILGGTHAAPGSTPHPVAGGATGPVPGSVSHPVPGGTTTGSAEPSTPRSWTPAPVRTHVDVVIDLMSLVGLAEQPGTITGHGPGGPQPLAAEAIRALVAADDTATMRRLVTDPLTGHLLDRGRSAYAVPTALRDFIVARDGTCRFPGCNRRAGLAQIDHANPWDRGGTTDRANLGALCIRHHQLKTHAGWNLTASTQDGAAHWRSPAGLDYDHPPPRLHARE